MKLHHMPSSLILAGVTLLVAGCETISPTESMTELPPRSDLLITATGTQQQVGGGEASYTVSLQNTSLSQVDAITLVSRLPNHYRVVQAEGAMHNGASNSLTWEVPSLTGEGTLAVQYRVVGLDGGSSCQVISAQSDISNQWASTEYCTEWIGHPALLLEMADSRDPVLIEGNTQFTVSVTNQGTARDYNVVIRMEFQPGLIPVNVSGAGRGNIQGRFVQMSPIPSLEPGQTVEWIVDAMGVARGDNRTQVALTSQALTEPVEEEESTRVF